MFPLFAMRIFFFTLILSIAFMFPISGAGSASDLPSGVNMDAIEEETEKTPKEICLEQYSARQKFMRQGAYTYLMRRCVRTLESKKELENEAKVGQTKTVLMKEAERSRVSGFLRGMQQRLNNRAAQQKGRFTKLRETRMNTARRRPRHRVIKNANTGSEKTLRGIRRQNAGSGSSM